MQPPPGDFHYITFSTQLGWMAIVVQENHLKRLVFGHPSQQSALKVLGKQLLKSGRPLEDSPLRERLQAYAEGHRDDFRDVLVDLSEMTAFQQKVLRHCRHIPFGKTQTYGELALQAGSPRAARAVGSCMARNPIPLVIPCHRVVASGGQLGNYSAPGGTEMKKRLLAMEGQGRDFGI